MFICERREEEVRKEKKERKNIFSGACLTLDLVTTRSVDPYV